MPLFFFDYSPGGAVVVFNTKSAVVALFGVDNVDIFPFVNSSDRAFKFTTAAFDAIFGDFIWHTSSSFI